MDENNQNDPAGQTPADQALPPETPSVEPTVNQVPPSQNPPVETSAPKTPTVETPAEPASSGQIPPGYEQSTPPPPPQQTAEPSIEPQTGASADAPVQQVPKKSFIGSVWCWVIFVAVIAVLAGGYYYYVT